MSCPQEHRTMPSSSHISRPRLTSSHKTWRRWRRKPLSGEKSQRWVLGRSAVLDPKVHLVKICFVTAKSQTSPENEPGDDGEGSGPNNPKKEARWNGQTQSGSHKWAVRTDEQNKGHGNIAMHKIIYIVSVCTYLLCICIPHSSNCDDGWWILYFQEAANEVSPDHWRLSFTTQIMILMRARRLDIGHKLRGYTNKFSLIRDVTIFI